MTVYIYLKRRHIIFTEQICYLCVYMYIYIYTEVTNELNNEPDLNKLYSPFCSFLR
jgi:hypothetical protein